MITCQLMVALAAEAKPLIDHFDLKPERNQRFRSYTNGTIALVETGMGKLNAAIATASALTRNTQTGQNPLCINIGIAGADRAFGELLVAHRIIDATTAKRWHPQLTAISLKNSIEVNTVTSPSTQYQKTTAFDMEAAGFIAAATRFSSLEFIHSLKVVSDNPTRSMENLDKHTVSDLIKAHLPAISSTLDELSALQQQLPEYSAINHLITDCKQFMKISATQESTLYRLLQRQLLIDHKLPTKEVLTQHKNVKSLLAALSDAVDSHGVRY